MTPELRRAIVRLNLKRLARSSKPILLGPWRSEVGFEALYLLAFLRWAATYAHLKPERFVTVTRGGAGILYGTAGVDLYQLRSVEEVRLENQYDWQGSKLQKQMRCTPWDRDVLKSAATKALGRREKYHVLHPAWMYWALEPFWTEQRGMQYLSSMTDYTPIGKVKGGDLELPQHFVAMKWYSRATFQGHTEPVRQAVAQITGIVAAQTPVVLLTGHPDVDDHVDLDVQHPNLIRLPAVSAEQNLAQQITALSRADAFIGTYGGMAQLALRLGVPSCSLYAEWGGTADAHLSLSGLISRRTKVPFLTGNFEDISMWKQVTSVTVKKPVLFREEALTA